MVFPEGDNLGMFHSEDKSQFFIGKCVVVAITILEIPFHCVAQNYFGRLNLPRVFTVNHADIPYPCHTGMMFGVWWKFRDEFMIYLLWCLVFPVLIKYPYDFPRGPGWFTGHDGERFKNSSRL